MLYASGYNTIALPVVAPFFFFFFFFVGGIEGAKCVSEGAKVKKKKKSKND